MISPRGDPRFFEAGEEILRAVRTTTPDEDPAFVFLSTRALYRVHGGVARTGLALERIALSDILRVQVLPPRLCVQWRDARACEPRTLFLDVLRSHAGVGLMEELAERLRELPRARPLPVSGAGCG